MSAPNAHSNSLHVIFPYVYEGQWVFDDDRFGLTREPFVLGADEVVGTLAAMVATGPDQRFKLIFASRPLPQAHLVADRVGVWSPESGAYYQTRTGQQQFW